MVWAGVVAYFAYTHTCAPALHSEQKVAQRRNRAEARERANPDCPVLMGEGNRRFVESALEESGFGLAWATER